MDAPIDPRTETLAERDARFAPMNDRMWGAGNWVRCADGCADSFGLPTYHHKDYHRAASRAAGRAE